MATDVKRTEIGELPAEWFAAKPEELVAETRNGDWGSAPDENAEDAVSARVIRGTDFPNAQAGSVVNTPVRLIQVSSLAKRNLEPGDVLIELSGGSKHQATGRALLIRDHLLNRSDHAVLFTNFVKRLRVDTSKVDPEFFWRAWSYAYWRGRTKTYEKRTTGIRNFKYRDFVSNEQFLVPPLPEQRAIARVLRTVQEAMEATERVIEAAKELKHSMMEYLFTYGPVPVDQADQVELSDAEGREAPAAWLPTRLEEIADVIVSTTSLKRLESLHATEGARVRVLYLKVSDLAHPLNKRTVNQAGIEFDIPESKVPDLRLVPANAVVFPKRGAAISTNRKRRTGTLAAMDPNLVAVVARRVESEYVFRWFERFDLRSLTEATMLPQLNKKDLEPLMVPKPEPDEQRQVGEHIGEVDGCVEAERSRLEGLKALFDSLLHNLMTGKLRVTPTEQDLEADE